ncbi:MAG: trypsin-like peptidase domain-containing protein [Verrucomicrobiota bacterium]|jgi:S1-C subfamily serine protease
MSLILGLLAAWVAGGRAGEPERSVVQIMTFAQQPAWDSPWRFEAVRRVGGSGFVIKGKRIMTNAHVVSWAREIIVRRYQDPRPYLAEMEYVGHDCDLAVLKVADGRFFEDLEPLEFGELPKVRSAVVTYGYPAGGEQISYTRGVVSRIELEPYSHIGNRHLLSAQTDAAINPGNSGGPVIQDQRVVGVAFQGIPGLENTGFFIPPPVIEHFLKDIEDQHYDGVPQAGVRLAQLQNPAYRSLLNLPDDARGARVDGLLPIPSSEKVLQEEDVILQIGSFPVASDGTLLYQGNRVSAALAFQLAQAGQSVPLQIWRAGRQQEVSLPVFPYTGDRAAGYQHDALPRYFVYGGLVFTPLSLDYLRTQGRGATDSAAGELYYELYYRRHETPKTARPEPVVLAAVLADAVNANVAIRGRALVDRINGLRIEKLEDVVRAFDSNTNAHEVIEFLPNHAVECLERSQAAKANAAILKTYGLTKDRRL